MNAREGSFGIRVPGYIEDTLDARADERNFAWPRQEEAD